MEYAWSYQVPYKQSSIQHCVRRPYDEQWHFSCEISSCYSPTFSNHQQKQDKHAFCKTVNGISADVQEKDSFSIKGKLQRMDEVAENSCSLQKDAGREQLCQSVTLFTVGVQP